MPAWRKWSWLTSFWHVIDGSAPDRDAQRSAVLDVLSSLGLQQGDSTEGERNRAASTGEAWDEEAGAQTGSSPELGEREGVSGANC